MKHFYLTVMFMLSICVGQLHAQETSAGNYQIPGGEWTVLGDGEYYEDVFTMIHWQKGLHWTVTVEESVDEPGWYRFVAYGDACPASILKNTIGEPDNESYMYINATDPDKAYVALSTFGNKYNICSYVIENDFDAQKYLNIEDGVISAPDSGIAYQTVDAGERWQLGNFFQNFKLVMPESEWKDYRFSLYTLDDKSCSEDNVFHYTIKDAGLDIKSFKAYAKLGYFNGSEEDTALAAENGIEAVEGQNTITATKRGRYALIVVAFNDKNEAVSTNSSYFYVMDDEADQWEEYGECVYYEDILGSTYPDMTTEKLNVMVEVNKNQPGYYRLVEPYKNHPYYSSGVYANMYRPHENHKHYLYVHAEDPEAVYIEDSPAGVDNGYGDASMFSLAYKHLMDGMSKEEISKLGLFGELDGREITFPDNSIILVERFYKQGAFVTVPAPMLRITLPKQTGINDITVDNANAPVEYFNLQGVRVDNPTSGVYIRRQGNQTEKIVID